MSSSSIGKPTNVLQFHRDAARNKAIASFEQDGFAADVFHNPDLSPPVWLFVLTRIADAEILYWGQERSRDRAEHAAQTMLQACATRAG